MDKDVLQFGGGFAMLDGFIPSKLSLRQVVSQVACVINLRDLIPPVLASLRLDTRRTSNAVSTWDEAVLADLRQKWVSNF